MTVSALLLSILNYELRVKVQKKRNNRETSIYFSMMFVFFFSILSEHFFQEVCLDIFE